MRTTVDLPNDLHELARQLAHEGNRSMSDVIAALIRLGLRQSTSELSSSRRGMPLLSVGHPVTTEDVRALDDDQ